MKIPFTEPIAPKYIYVNPLNNTIHLLMPVVSGAEIGLDNTCQSISALREFFGLSQGVEQRSALDELTAYQQALEFDISLIAGDSDVKNQKQERLIQIMQYIEAIAMIKESRLVAPLKKEYPSYPKALQRIMVSEESNLHSMLLRPQEMDFYIKSIGHVFSLTREGSSVFQEVLANAYEAFSPVADSKEKIIQKVLVSLSKQIKGNNFSVIRKTLTKTIQDNCNTLVNFKEISSGGSLTKRDIDESLSPQSARDYIEALLGYCAPNLFETEDQSPFRSAKNAEQLSIVTQFFLGRMNIYCYSIGITSTDFGRILDQSISLSEIIATMVLFSLRINVDPEVALCNFFNDNKANFGLIKQLEPDDNTRIIKQFRSDFAQIKDSPHFDEFIVLDTSKPGPFLSRQGSICINFAEVMQSEISNLSKFFQSCLVDFREVIKSKDRQIGHINTRVYADIELSLEELVLQIQNEEQLQRLLAKLPVDQQVLLRNSPLLHELQFQKFLHCVARGEEAAARKLLGADLPVHYLRQSGPFTDYSGRTFNCSAFEYAYWAKDWHMCCMLLEFMDEETKAETLVRCEAIEDSGLTYIQYNVVKRSSHFNLTRLIDALENYVTGAQDWYAKQEWHDLTNAWMQVGLVQREVPAHVAQEYCRSDRRPVFLPSSHEGPLPRKLIFNDLDTQRQANWFPLAANTNSGLGYHFVIYGAVPDGSAQGSSSTPLIDNVRCDMDAMKALDKKRTSDLRQLREALQPVSLLSLDRFFE